MKLSLSLTAVAFTFLGSAAAAPHGLAKKAGKSDGFTILAGGGKHCNRGEKTYL
jgi:hypothetical protein